MYLSSSRRKSREVFRSLRWKCCLTGVILNTPVCIVSGFTGSLLMKNLQAVKTWWTPDSLSLMNWALENNVPWVTDDLRTSEEGLHAGTCTVRSEGQIQHLHSSEASLCFHYCQSSGLCLYCYYWLLILLLLLYPIWQNCHQQKMHWQIAELQTNQWRMYFRLNVYVVKSSSGLSFFFCFSLFVFLCFCFLICARFQNG